MTANESAQVTYMGGGDSLVPVVEPVNFSPTLTRSIDAGMEGTAWLTAVCSGAPGKVLKLVL